MTTTRITIEVPDWVIDHPAGAVWCYGAVVAAVEQAKQSPAASTSDDTVRAIADNDRRRAEGNRLLHAPVRISRGNVVAEARIENGRIVWPSDQGFRTAPHGDTLLSPAERIAEHTGNDEYLVPGKVAGVDVTFVRDQARPDPKPEKIGTYCECGAPYVYIARLRTWGYQCAR